MKYIIAGGRDFNNYDVLTKILNIFINPKKDIIFSGGARGADELGARYAAENSIPLQMALSCPLMPFSALLDKCIRSTKVPVPYAPLDNNL